MKLLVRDRQFYKTLLVIAIPIALQNLITNTVSMMDTLMIGQLGETQLSATSIANQLWFMLMVLVFGIAGGANVLLAQYWGKGDVETIRHIQSMTFKVALVASLCFTAIALFLPRQFMSIFTPDSNVIEYGTQYLRILSWSYPFYALASVALMMLRSVGTVNISVVVYLTSLIVNTTLNYVLIFGHFGAPALGVRGGAIATSIARCFEFAITAVYILTKESKIKFTLKELLINNKAHYKKYVSLSIPVIGNELMWGLGTAMTAVVIGRMGTAFVAANSIYMVLNQMVLVMIFGVGNAALTVIGNTIGMGRYDLAKQRAVTLYVLALFLGLAAGLLTLLLCPVLLAFYSHLSVQTLNIARSIIYVGAIVVIFQSLAIIGMTGILRAGGDAKFVFTCELTFLWLIAVPLGFLTGLVLGWPAPAVFFVLKCDEILKTAVSTVRILNFGWLRDVTA